MRRAVEDAVSPPSEVWELWNIWPWQHTRWLKLKELQAEKSNIGKFLPTKQNHWSSTFIKKKKGTLTWLKAIGGGTNAPTPTYDGHIYIPTVLYVTLTTLAVVWALWSFKIFFWSELYWWTLKDRNSCCLQIHRI